VSVNETWWLAGIETVGGIKGSRWGIKSRECLFQRRRWAGEGHMWVGVGCVCGRGVSCVGEGVRK
jgi:hypothetical protein